MLKFVYMLLVALKLTGGGGGGGESTPLDQSVGQKHFGWGEG